MANTIIQIKKSLVSGISPTQLANGEIAINSVDGKLFYSKPDKTISYITNQQSFATVNANSSLLLATSETDTLSISPGNNISISACTVSKVLIQRYYALLCCVPANHGGPIALMHACIFGAGKTGNEVGFISRVSIPG